MPDPLKIDVTDETWPIAGVFVTRVVPARGDGGGGA
jgi:hypothetical protein